MNVYLVQSVSFGDSKMNGVYESRKLAEEACELLNSDIEADVDMLLITEMKLNDTNQNTVSFMV